MHFEGHPTGVDVQQFVLHMVDTIRDAASGRAESRKEYAVAMRKTCLLSLILFDC